jgi:hypothetical protein
MMGATGSYTVIFHPRADGRLDVNAWNISSVTSAAHGTLLQTIWGGELPHWTRGEGTLHWPFSDVQQNYSFVESRR